ncbi:GrpB family protein [Shouchella lonarensis]|uniref:GrpB domain, predicted nucleotidyltransferase, UPF0157 family n=1 Tax=Shouchella lonarensis TaxID=1464122 RepID=A0A1G6HF60_9BACI|nr:GrpB family protein [Shouchella lonarensis]SDB92879.1 GrpB domain, predicted nucleotidyltransferase, UPF0157 family [Shouchella lonarensis]
MRQVIVTPYQTAWIDQFVCEAVRLKHIFANHIVACHHIGSTAVPGLLAKPVIDVLIEVHEPIVRVDELNEAMKQIGYEAKGENGIEGRRYFQKGGDQRTHHVHVFETGSRDVCRHLAVRDYLRAHPKEAHAYGELKRILAAMHPTNITAYISGKHEHVQQLEAAALAWYMQ